MSSEVLLVTFFIDPGPHVIGRKLSEVFLNRFRRNYLVFEIHGFSSTADMPADYTARAHEQQVIAEYIQTFGEPPPFDDQR